MFWTKLLVVALVSGLTAFVLTYLHVNSFVKAAIFGAILVAVISVMNR
jgi:ribose/xylose/arabinose/galactoside ABC-type transport system permease subunit